MLKYHFDSYMLYTLRLILCNLLLFEKQKLVIDITLKSIQYDC